MNLSGLWATSVTYTWFMEIALLSQGPAIIRHILHVHWKMIADPDMHSLYIIFILNLAHRHKGKMQIK